MYPALSASAGRFLMIGIPTPLMWQHQRGRSLLTLAVSVATRIGARVRRTKQETRCTFKSDAVYAVTSTHRTISGTDNCNLANFQYNFTTNTQAVFEMMVHSIPHLKASAARLPNKVCASGTNSVTATQGK